MKPYTIYWKIEGNDYYLQTFARDLIHCMELVQAEVGSYWNNITYIEIQGH